MDAADTTLVIKNPSRTNQSFSINFSLDGTVGDLQKLLSETYDGRPAPEDQTLIYAGKVLKDTSARLCDIITKGDGPTGPYSFHLVVRNKQSTGLPAQTRSMDSTASSSAFRAGSTAAAAGSTGIAVGSAGNAGNPSFTRSHSFPTRSGLGSGAGSSIDPTVALAQIDIDALLGACQILNNLTPYSAAGGGLYGAAFSGYPFARPPAVSAASSSVNPVCQEGSSTAAAAGAVPSLSSAAEMPYTYYNPVIGSAYQAAYSAALAALTVAPQQPLPKPQQEHPGQEAKENVPSQPDIDQSSSANNGTAGAESTASSSTTTALSTIAEPVAQQYVYVPMFVPAYGQAGYPFAMHGPTTFPQPSGSPFFGGMPWAPSSFGQPWQPVIPPVSRINTQESVEAIMEAIAILNAFTENATGAAAGGGRQGGRGQDSGAGQANRAAANGDGQQGLRVRRARFVIPLGPAPGNEQPAAAMADRNRPAAARWRPRVIRIRVSLRMLLQALVVAFMVSQNLTWKRLMALTIIGAVMYIATLWAPFLVRRDNPRLGAPQGRADDAAGPAAGAGAAVAGLAAGPQQQRAQFQRRGMLHEILVFVVGFVTSLLPAWNIFAEDAAALVAGQQDLAEDDGVRQQQAAAGDGDVAPAEGAGAEPGQANNDVQEGVAAGQ